MKSTSSIDQNCILVEININDDEYRLSSPTAIALEDARVELQRIEETISSLDKLKANADKLDYALAASSGVLCGLFDIFLVGKPGESPVGNISDKWFANKTMGFAKLCGWNSEDDSSSSAIRFLEKKFKIPYDQTGTGDVAKSILDLTPDNHHFKSLSHNPSLLGLFFSILDQFNSPFTSHFVSEGELITLNKIDAGFELRGDTVSSKLFCAFINWFGHIVSDVSGSSGSKGRGMGIPSPLWTWTNDVIAIKQSLHVPISDFDMTANELALNIFKKGYDIRFQTSQFIPVIINEMVVKFIYAFRRLIKYISGPEIRSLSFSNVWDICEPFSNQTVKRMLTVAHGTFCLLDVGDATIRSFTSGAGVFNAPEFFLRLNIAGVGKFSFSLFGEATNSIAVKNAKPQIILAKHEHKIVTNYIEALETLAVTYDDSNLINFVDDIKEGKFHEALQKTVELDRKRGVDESIIVENKAEIDSYFEGRKTR